MSHNVLCTTHQLLVALKDAYLILKKDAHSFYKTIIKSAIVAAPTRLKGGFICLQERCEVG